MTGPEMSHLEDPGLLPRSFEHIFTNIDSTSTSTQYLVRGSFIEIYNEEIRDLLSSNPRERCDLKDSPTSGVYVKDLSVSVVKSVADINGVLMHGLQNRSSGATDMNHCSSRSHSIFLITVEQCAIGADGEGHIRVGKLNMVDLAGSERETKVGTTGERQKEATKINLSLSALGNVISSLVDGKSFHVPYRDSNLTRLLQDSLGGNTKTVMVANIGPASGNYEETLSTLRYATRAKSIKNKPHINEDPKDTMLREFQDEIVRLKAELSKNAEESAKAEPPAPLPPRIEKQVEYVEKIIEKNVEREVIVQHGPTPEEIAAKEMEMRKNIEQSKRVLEQKRAEVTAQRDISEDERKKLLAELDREEKKRADDEQRKTEMQAKLVTMEQKMVMGKQVMEKAIEQEEELKKQQRQLRKQRKVEEQLRLQEEHQRQENLELETKCASQEDQVQRLTIKLQKLWEKYQKAQQEMVDVQQFNQSEREDMLAMIRDLRQTLKLKSLIMDAFVPSKEVQLIQDRAYWDAEEDEWKLGPRLVDKNRPVRPGSLLGLPRPTTEFARMNRRMGDTNPRFMYDSILITDLDLPERTTEDYDLHPELNYNIERTLLNALSPDDDDDSRGADRGRDKGDKGDKGDRPERTERADIVDDQPKRERSNSGTRRRPTSSRPSTGRSREQDTPREAAFPQARGLVSRE